jgi:hypothetical protein
MSLGGRIMHRAKPVAEKLDDYFVIIKRFRQHRTARRSGWTWEIRRTTPRGAKYRGVQYATPQAAKLAGETALRELLNNRIQRAI